MVARPSGSAVAHGGNQRQLPTEGNPPAVLAPQDGAASPSTMLS
ncbi:hypothetical protein [Scytonema sp. HK-05]|nr:hypothetical protein [Scytonema sp. HK-05]